MKVTIRDVASKAGVSAATVSRVLNKPELVDPETKQRVQAAIKALDFHPNAMARGLSVSRTDTIGLVIPGINDLFFTELYRGIEKACSENNMKILLFDSQHSRHRALEGFTFLRRHQVSGIIFTSKLVDQDYDALFDRIGIPVALALTEATGRTPLPAFKVDDVRAVFDVVAYLVARGHQRIGMITGESEDDRTGLLRLEGYRRAILHFGIGYSESFVTSGNYRFDGGYAAMQELLKRQPINQLTAICTASDEMAIGAMRCLHDHGLSVPDDMSVIGFDDLQIARMVIPSLTTVMQPFEEIGEQVVRALLQRIEQPSELPRQGTYYMPHRIVERETVKCLNSSTSEEQLEKCF
ncbi:LacI family transcriptional regulator [Alicyclobacillus sp. TC]|uniref:LacI family DNA-binding transcriptional regulator n=1 Tax=Alicyclobacillus sp. TC TaxID=2606450 RepID=UPI00193397D6|nr:LacI family DNA-binding transcriptional regulator [Alicyclobacillus sp. TC]QRF24148.1 LacI family transcriptional regulator [Alicyclobacillus sp. TC]